MTLRPQETPALQNLKALLERLLQNNVDFVRSALGDLHPRHRMNPKFMAINVE